MGEQSLLITTALDNFASLTVAAAHNPHLFFDEDWKLKIALALAIITEVSTSLSALIQAENLEFEQQPENKLDEVTTLMNNFVEQISKGIDDIDPDQISRAAETLSTIYALVQETPNATAEKLQNAQLPRGNKAFC